MIKTIKVKKEMNFRELMKYILENDIRDKEFRCREDDKIFLVRPDDRFVFHAKHYNTNELYEVEVEEEITEDTEFFMLVELFDGDRIDVHYRERIKYLKDVTTEKIYALIDGELQKIWERGY